MILAPAHDAMQCDGREDANRPRQTHRSELRSKSHMCNLKHSLAIVTIGAVTLAATAVASAAPGARFLQTRVGGMRSAPAIATSLSSPQGDIFDASGDLWVANSGTNQVLEYTAATLRSNSPQAQVVIQGLAGPARLAFNPTNASELWVANAQGNSVAEYDVASPGSPIEVLTRGISEPLGIAVDDDGNVYVANNASNSITVYPAGSTSPAQTWTTDNQGNPFSAPGAMFLYGAGSTKAALYVGFGPDSAPDSVISYSLASVLGGPIPEVQRTFTSGISGPTGISVGNHQKPVYVANFYAGTVVGFGVRPPDAQTIDTPGQPNGVAVSPSNRDLYVALGSQNEILQYSPQGTILKTLH
jgi:DNA-binding beta-propeller fold protein YncE